MDLLQKAVRAGWIYASSIAAGVATAFVATWSLQVSSAATIWTAAGAIGSLAAAVGAVYAARTAVSVAQLPIVQQDTFRRAKANVIAVAILNEFEGAIHTMNTTRNILNTPPCRQEKDTLEGITKVFRIDQTAMIERFLGEFDAFGLKDGAIICEASGALLNFNRQMDGVNVAVNSALQELINGGAHLETIADQGIGICTASMAIIEKAIPLIRAHGDH